jgi:prepilin-type N-terminal cleavage/methylation domain-containing protein
MTRHRGEGGFTLIEMVLTMTLLSLVIAPLSAAIFLGLRTETDVQARLAESNSANAAASYFATDLQQALLVVVDTSESAGVCGASAAPVKLLLTPPSLDSSVSYFVDPADPKILRRRTCAAGAVTGPPAGVPLMRNLSGAPAVTCSTTGCTMQVGQQVQGLNPYSTTLIGTKRIQ